MSIAQITADLTMYRKARAAILEGAQSYSVPGHNLTRGDLKFIQQQIDTLEIRLERKQRGGLVVKSPVLGV